MRHYRASELRMITGYRSNEVSPFDSLASVYDSWFEQKGKIIFALEVQAFQEILPSLPRPWLEIGVGSGRFAQALGIETGIDPSIEMLQMAKRHGISVFAGRGEQQVFDSASYGTAFLIVTLCFVNSTLDVLKETYRVLINGGKAVLGLVLKESPWGSFYQQKKREGHPFYKYATFHSYDDLVKMLKQVGFSIEIITSTLFQEPGKVTHLEPPRKGFYPDAGFTVIVAGKNI